LKEKKNQCSGLLSEIKKLGNYPPCHIPVNHEKIKKNSCNLFSLWDRKKSIVLKCVVSLKRISKIFFRKEIWSMKKALYCVLVTILLGSAVFGADQIPYKTGFEASEGFVAGNTINGQDGWIVDSAGGDAKITDTMAQTGSQSVALEANSQIDKPLAAAAGDTIVWMEGYFRGAGTSEEPSFPALVPASAIVFFSATNGIQCLDGDGAGAGPWVNTSVTSLEEETWYKITIRQDYSAKTWKCYINDAQSPVQELGFRDDTVATLNGFRNFADTVSYLDNFRVIPAKKGDTNGDGKVDASDVITLINDPDGSGFDIIQGDNADVDSNGSIEAADLSALIDILLGIS
jgi:hypothetical protein